MYCMLDTRVNQNAVGDAHALRRGVAQTIAGNYQNGCARTHVSMRI